MRKVAYVLNINHTNLRRSEVNVEGLLPVWHQLKVGRTQLGLHILTQLSMTLRAVIFAYFSVFLVVNISYHFIMPFPSCPVVALSVFPQLLVIWLPYSPAHLFPIPSLLVLHIYQPSFPRSSNGLPIVAFVLGAACFVWPFWLITCFITLLWTFYPNDNVVHEICLLVNIVSLSKGGSYQREIVRVDPDNAEVRVISVLACHLLQDFQEFITV